MILTIFHASFVYLGSYTCIFLMFLKIKILQNKTQPKRSLKKREKLMMIKKTCFKIIYLKEELKHMLPHQENKWKLINLTLNL